MAVTTDGQVAPEGGVEGQNTGSGQDSQYGGAPFPRGPERQYADSDTAEGQTANERPRPVVRPYDATLNPEGAGYVTPNGPAVRHVPSGSRRTSISPS